MSNVDKAISGKTSEIDYFDEAEGGNVSSKIGQVVLMFQGKFFAAAIIGQ